MCSRPEVLLEPFVQAGAEQLTVHVELGHRVESLLWKIKSLGVRAGLAINPPTPMRLAQPFLRSIDTLLVMTVNPGFASRWMEASRLKRSRNAPPRARTPL
jgi:ribulose-phosphate 3-epimerase